MCWFQQSPTSSRPGFPVENRARVRSPVIPMLGTGIHEFGLVYPLNPPEFRCSATVYIEKVVDARAEHGLFSLQEAHALARQSPRG